MKTISDKTETDVLKMIMELAAAEAEQSMASELLFLRARVEQMTQAIGRIALAVSVEYHPAQTNDRDIALERVRSILREDMKNGEALCRLHKR